MEPVKEVMMKNIKRISLPEDVRKIINTIEEAGFEAYALFISGSFINLNGRNRFRRFFDHASCKGAVGLGPVPGTAMFTAQNLYDPFKII